MKNLSLKQKLILVLIIVGTIPLLVASLVAFNVSREALVKAEFCKLNSINQLKKKRVISYFERLEGELHVVKDNPYIVTTLNQFDETFMKAGDSINSNEWRELKEQHKMFFSDIVADLKIDDLVLMCPEGSIVYTADQKGDLGLFVTKEPLKSSPFGKAFSDLHAKSLDIILGDFAPYAPANNLPTAFLIACIRNEKKEIEAHVAFSVAISSLNEIMSVTDGMGVTGDSYLVGSDLLLRSDSVKNKQYTVASSFEQGLKIDFEAVALALSGKAGTGRMKNHLKQDVLVAYDFIKIGDITWAVISEISSDEALTSVTKLIYIFTTMAIIFVLLIVGVGYLFANRLSNPMILLSNNIKNISAEVSSASVELSNSSTELSSSSSEQASSIEETSSSLEEMTQMTENNLTQAKHSHELATKIQEITIASNQSMNKLEVSIDKIVVSNEQIRKLVDVISNIGEKTKVMDEIVFQTKLLSFNASVEAERAGEHGRGFAVVAQEVGNLAQMSGKAAHEIAEIVGLSIKEATIITGENQKNVEESTQHVKETDSNLKQIGEMSATLLESSQQLLKASSEQSLGIKQISLAINQIDKSTQQNAAIAEETASSSEELTAQTNSLDQIVNDITKYVKG